MHKIYSALKGFANCYFRMRGYDSEQNQLIVFSSGDGNGSGDSSFGGSGYGKGQSSLANGDGFAMNVERSFEVANA